MSKYFEEVADFLVENKGIDRSKINENSTFADLQLDSLDVMDMLMEFEEKFKVEIEMNSNLKTVGDIAKFIEDKKNKK